MGRQAHRQAAAPRSDEGRCSTDTSAKGPRGQPAWTAAHSAEDRRDAEQDDEG